MEGGVKVTTGASCNMFFTFKAFSRKNNALIPDFITLRQLMQRERANASKGYLTFLMKGWARDSEGLLLYGVSYLRQLEFERRQLKI